MFSFDQFNYPRILRNELRQGSAALLLGCAECEVAIDREQMYLQTMNKGEAQLSASQMKRLSTMTVAAEKYEDEVLDLPPKKISNRSLKSSK